MPDKILIIQGTPNGTGGQYAQLKTENDGRVAFKNQSSGLYLYWKNFATGGMGWHISDELGGTGIYAYCPEDAADPKAITMPFMGWSLEENNFVAFPATIKEMQVGGGATKKAAPRIVLMGREGPNAMINGGYVKLKEDYNGRPAYKFGPYNGRTLFLYFKQGEWRIGDTLGDDAKYASNPDMDALLPEQIDEPWEIADGPRMAKDKNLRVEVWSKKRWAAPEVPDGFIDPQFKPCQKSVGSKEPTSWMRASQLSFQKGKQFSKLFNTVDPGDLVQGDLGNCWLIASMAAVAEFPWAIKRLFKTKEFNPEGRYEMQLYDVTKKAWVSFTIDDHIPCEEMKWWMKKGRPRFAKPVGNELWCMLLEKAFAKFFGNYERLVGGICSVAFQCLTGSAEQYVWDKEGGKQKWERARVAVEEQIKRRTIVTTYEPDQFATDEELFDVFSEYDKKKFIISCSISAGAEKTREDGLVEGHAYTLLRVVDLPQHGLRLCKLRNPWGGGATHEWKGDFSDKSSRWTPELKAELGVSGKADGQFWMTWADFASRFNHSCVSPRSMAKEGTGETETGASSPPIGSPEYINGPGMEEDMGWDDEDDHADWDEDGWEEDQGEWEDADFEPKGGPYVFEDHYGGEGYDDYSFDDPDDYDDSEYEGERYKTYGTPPTDAAKGAAGKAKTEIGAVKVQVPAVKAAENNSSCCTIM
uniref:Calpain catalytic domain-containing protein n=1 Tax=Chromera velia CCMP2878 TaxID=1169474 RepID=A0A0G4G111_9ALVE|eukprot:Cvel_4020.t1-p1 / transcript=Cvel_4020.t1 / gene=Cvel_4020 / organism=Chromera_velia_CCMP2878 / gene_product=Calpain-D, putative / transcript_product=Calpain-D, putative / location=Cvel_scaffold171:26773-29833(-) / protein_length=697 / sequence_SO=supercontig / SO=protein_coding / is_pseudo=false